MRNIDIKLRTFSINHLLLIKIFEYKYLINKINEPHNRSLLFNSIVLNTQKYNQRVISEI